MSSVAGKRLICRFLKRRCSSGVMRFWSGEARNKYAPETRGV